MRLIRLKNTDNNAISANQRLSDVARSLVQSEDLDGVHVVRVPLGDGQQTAAASTAVDRFRVFDGVLVGQQVAHVTSGRVEHADPRAVVCDQDVATKVDRQAARTQKPTATLLTTTTRPEARHRNHGGGQWTSRVRGITPEQESTACKLQPATRCG